jgi:hypothetical protein
MTALLLLSCPALLSAQDGVTVEHLAVDADTVTFDVRWDNNHPAGFLWSDTVWVWVDYNDDGALQRLPLRGATLTAPSWAGASVTFAPGNDRGAWVVGNARSAPDGSFSATVRLQADADAAHIVLCAYASNYPPVGRYATLTKIVFSGTPGYDIVMEDAEGHATPGWSPDSTFTLPDGYTALSFTDKTGAPGRWINGLVPPDPTGKNVVQCHARTAKLYAESEGAVIDWYGEPTGGNPYRTNNNYHAVARTGAGTSTYYAEARYVQTGVVSRRRTPVSLTVLLAEGRIGGRED